MRRRCGAAGADSVVEWSDFDSEKLRFTADLLAIAKVEAAFL